LRIFVFKLDLVPPKLLIKPIKIYLSLFIKKYGSTKPNY
jgi:hypothetical protein